MCCHQLMLLTSKETIFVVFLPTKFHCHSFNALEVLKGVGWGVGEMEGQNPRPPGSGAMKPRINRVNKYTYYV